MKKIYLIRHAVTKSNALRLFLGQSDEPLSEQGIDDARALFSAGVPEAEKIFVSPLTRCRQTAEILFPNARLEIIDEFIEINFGKFEGKNHDQLIANVPEYKIWLDSGGRSQIPGGENMAALRARCRVGFFKVLGLLGEKNSAALVVHGGTIMALLEEFGDGGNFYDHFPKNCDIISCCWDGNFLRAQK